MGNFVYSSRLERLVSLSCLLIRHAYRHVKWQGDGSRLEVAYSGGKDSDVLVELCKLSGVWGKELLRPLHRCTTIDPPMTLSHCVDVGVEIYRSNRFVDCVRASGFPTRFIRHCCGKLKEFVVEDYVLLGIRRCESANRAKNYKEPEQCRVYNNGGRCIQYYPLLDWSDDDIAEFIDVHKIRCHPLYYDDNGVFHVERRLGCVGCVLASKKNRVRDFKNYPRFLRFWCRIGAEYMRTHPDAQCHKYFKDVYEWMVCDLFYDSVQAFRRDYDSPVLSLFDDVKKDCKRRLEDYFGIKL